MCRLILMTIACLLVLFGVFGLWMMPKQIQIKIEQKIQLKIGTKSFERFTKVPIPLTVKFYLFNVTNGEQVLRGVERPKFQQVGPFVYKQWRRREIQDLLDNNRRVKYREIKTFYPEFAPTATCVGGRRGDSNLSTARSSNTTGDRRAKKKKEKNNDDDDDDEKLDRRCAEMLNPEMFNITMVNLPLLSLLTKLAQLEEGSMKRRLVTGVANRLVKDGRDRILITKPANQILFDGYKVDFMESARELISGTLGLPYEQVAPLPLNVFGLLHSKNDTWSRRDAGELVVFTGRNESMKDFMQVESWNDQKILKVWPSNTPAGDRCNEIKGSDGSQFQPGVDRAQVLSIFSPQICTSVRVRYKEDTEVRGIPLLRFSTPPDTFAAPRKNAQKACYCTVVAGGSDYLRPPPRSSVSLVSAAPASSSSSDSGERQSSQTTTSGQSKIPQTPQQQPISRITDSRCYLDGLIDLSLCQRGAPVAASAPHFYNADPMLAMASGLAPDPVLHETYLDIEPMTGAVFRAASRAQLNAYVEQAALAVLDSEIVGNMSAMVAPLMWMEETAEIDDKSAAEFKAQLLDLVGKARRSFVYAIVAGALIALGVSLHFWLVDCRHQRLHLAAEAAAAKAKAKVKVRATGGGRRGSSSSKMIKTRSASPTSSSESSSSSSSLSARREHHLGDNLRLAGARESNLAEAAKIEMPLLEAADEEQ